MEPQDKSSFWNIKLSGDPHWYFIARIIYDIATIFPIVNSIHNFPWLHVSLTVMFLLWFLDIDASNALARSPLSIHFCNLMLANIPSELVMIQWRWHCYSSWHIDDWPELVTTIIKLFWTRCQMILIIKPWWMHSHMEINPDTFYIRWLPDFHPFHFQDEVANYFISFLLVSLPALSSSQNHRLQLIQKWVQSPVSSSERTEACWESGDIQQWCKICGLQWDT